MAWFDCHQYPHIVDLIALSGPQHVKWAFRSTSLHFRNIIDEDSFYHVVISLSEKPYNARPLSRFELRSGDGVLRFRLDEALGRLFEGTRIPLLQHSTKVLEVEWLVGRNPRVACSLIAGSLPDFKPRIVLNYNMRGTLNSLPMADIVFAKMGAGVPERTRKLVVPHTDIPDFLQPDRRVGYVELMVIIWSSSCSQAESDDDTPQEVSGTSHNAREDKDVLFFRRKLRQINAGNFLMVNAGRHESALRSIAPGDNRHRNLQFTSLESYLTSLGDEERRMTTRWMDYWLSVDDKRWRRKLIAFESPDDFDVLYSEDEEPEDY